MSDESGTRSAIDVTAQDPATETAWRVRRLAYAETQWVRDTVMAAPRAAA